MSGELPHNLTHQDQRRNVWSPDSEGVIFLPVIVKPYHWSYIHTQPQATTQCIQGPDALSWRLTELSSTPWLRKTHRRNEV